MIPDRAAWAAVLLMVKRRFPTLELADLFLLGLMLLWVLIAAAWVFPWL